MQTVQESFPLQMSPESAAQEGWHLDERTKEIGRRGLAEARAALAEASKRAQRRDAERRANKEAA